MRIIKTALQIYDFSYHFSLNGYSSGRTISKSRTKSVEMSIWSANPSDNGIFYGAVLERERHFFCEKAQCLSIATNLAFDKKSIDFFKKIPYNKYATLEFLLKFIHIIFADNGYNSGGIIS